MHQGKGKDKGSEKKKFPPTGSTPVGVTKAPKRKKDDSSSVRMMGYMSRRSMVS